jgi:hypothetical protein
MNKNSEELETEDYEPLLPNQKAMRGGKRERTGRKKGSTKEKGSNKAARGMKLAREKFPELGAKDARQWLHELNKFGMWEYYILHRDVNVSLRAWLYLNDRAYGKPFVSANPDLMQQASDPADDPRMQSLLAALQGSKPSVISVTQTKAQLTVTPVSGSHEHAVVPTVDSRVTIDSGDSSVGVISHPSTQKPPHPEVGVHSPPQFFQKLETKPGEGREGEGEQGKRQGGKVEEVEDIQELRRKARMWELHGREKSAGVRGKSKVRISQVEPIMGEVGDTPGSGGEMAVPGSNEREGAL